MIGNLKTLVISLMATWHKFWFSPTDPIVPSTLRFFVGAMLFYTLLVWGVDLEAFFSKASGWQSVELVSELQRNDWALSFWWLVPDSMIWPMHFVCLAIIFAFWIGLGTTITKWLSLAIIVSYANRVPLANYGLDQFNTILTMYLCLGPCGARLSADHAIAAWNAKRNTSDSPNEHSSMAGFSMRMVQVHLCIVYFFAGLSKLQGVAWWNGQAVWMASANFEYQQFSLTWLAYVPWLYQVATISTWVWELSFAFLVWNRFARPFVLLVGISMHIGIGMFMGMWTFGLIMCFAYIAFIPDDILIRLLRALHAVHALPQSVDSLGVVESRELGVIANVRRTNDVVVLIESNARKRYTFTKLLKRIGYRCVAVDSWPEALDVFEPLGAHSVICQGGRIKQRELEYWVDQLSIHSNAQRAGSRPLCVAMFDSNRNANSTDPQDARLVALSVPVYEEDLSAVLEGQLPLRVLDDREDIQLAAPSESETITT